MRRAWRIVKQSRATAAFDGEGAWLFGGRWNSPGIRIVYTSASLSLAALETLVHLNPAITFKFVAIPVEFDDAQVEIVSVASLAADWTEEPPPPSTQQIGDQWARESRSAVLAVPSVIVPSEINYLFNPVHPDFPKITIGKPAPFPFDRRLL